MSETKKKSLIQRNPIISVLFFFLFAWAWLLFITFWKPSFKKNTKINIEYADTQTKNHFIIKNDSLILNKKTYKILKNERNRGINIITARNLKKDSIKVLIYDKKVYLIHD